jgi:hypothetical protein
MLLPAEEPSATVAAIWTLPVAKDSATLWTDITLLRPLATALALASCAGVQ